MRGRSPRSEIRKGKSEGLAPRPFRVSGKRGRLQWVMRMGGRIWPGGADEVEDRRDACPARWTRAVCMALFGLSALIGSAAESADGGQEAFKLRPPHAELPPTYWEQYGAWTVVGIVVLLLLVGAALWWLLRPKPVVPEPIEVLARRELEALRQRVEDGQVLSQISRVVRGYVAGAFALPTDELTTTEFCQVILAHEKIGPELASTVGDFLRHCDQLKFAPVGKPNPIGAAAQALELVELGEARRAHLRKLESEAVSNPSAPGA